MNVFVHTFAKMIEHGLVTIDQIPAEHREDTRQYIESGKLESSTEDSTVGEAVPENNQILGALRLPKLDSVNIDMDTLAKGKSITARIKKREIFSSEVLNGNPSPENVQYEVIRIENVYGKFEDDLNVELGETSQSVTVTLTGTPKDVVIDATVLRIDILIHSSNYEDMRLTVYFKAN